MGITVKAMSDSASFLKSMTPSAGLQGVIEALSQNGVKFDTQFYHFTATYKGAAFQTVLPVGTNSLAKHHLNKQPFTPEVAVAETKLRAALVELGQKVLGVDAVNTLLFGTAKPGNPNAMAEFLSVQATALPKGSQPMSFLTPPKQKEAVHNEKYKSAYNAATGKLPDMKPGTVIGDMDEGDQIPVGIIKSLPEAAIPKPVLKPIPKAASVVAKAKLETPIKLIEAEVPGQRVFGSSNGSIYTCIGVTPFLKLAVRFADGQLSFRIEGSGLTHSSVLSTLQNNGFDAKQGYASMHLSCGQMAHARRAIGSVLYGTGVNYSAKLEQLESIFS